MRDFERARVARLRVHAEVIIGVESTDELTGRAVTPKLDGTFSDRVAERTARVAGTRVRRIRSR